eukprot:9919986-Ditylum_brightwellii.AAC.1
MEFNASLAIGREKRVCRDVQVLLASCHPSCYGPKKENKLTQEETNASFQYLMSLNKKHCGRIKGCRCAGGRKQRLYTPKDNASAPTVAMETLMLSCLINTMERRGITTGNISRCLHAGGN